MQYNGKFYKALMESDKFTDKAKEYITKVYEDIKKDYYRKISRTLKLNVNTGRPKAVKNEAMFNILATYYNKGLIRQRDIEKTFNMKKTTFYKYYAECRKNNNFIDINIKTTRTKEEIDILIQYYTDYAPLYVNKYKSHINQQEREDFYYECMTDILQNLLDYDESMSFKAYCCNICQKNLNIYIQEMMNRKQRCINYQDSEYMSKLFN